MYTIMYETSSQSRFNARYWMLGTSALGRPRGMVWGGGGRPTVSTPDLVGLALTISYRDHVVRLETGNLDFARIMA